MRLRCKRDVEQDNRLVTDMHFGWVSGRTSWYETHRDTGVTIQLYHDMLRYSTKFTENVKTELKYKLLCMIWVVLTHNIKIY